MSEDLFAILTLAFYLVAGTVIVFDQFRRCEARFFVWLFYSIERLYVGLLFRWRSSRPCPFPERGAAILFANHRSPVDPLLVWMNHHLGFPSRRIRAITFLMAREYYDVPFVNWICRTMQAIPVDRTGKDVRPTHEALERLQNEQILCLFPEGRINTGEPLLEADTGIAWLALHSQVPVYPVFLHNSPRSYSMVSPFWTPSRVRVTYGEPIDLTRYYHHRLTHELLTEVTDLLMRRLAELGGTHYVKDVPLPIAGPPTVPLLSEQRTA